jgi:hypothetical protein
MPTDPLVREPVEEPLAALERILIRDYVSAAGLDFDNLLTRHDDQAIKVLAAASMHAAAKLAEVEARAHYLKKLHGEE